MGAFHNKIDEDMTIKLIQSLSKTFEHNTFYFIDVLMKLRDSDMIKFQYVTLLIKN
jgi:lysine-N-methylase